MEPELLGGSGAGTHGHAQNCRFCVVFTGNLVVGHTIQQCTNSAKPHSIGSGTQTLARFISKHSSPRVLHLSATPQQRREVLVQVGMCEDCLAP